MTRPALCVPVSALAADENRDTVELRICVRPELDGELRTEWHTDSDEVGRLAVEDAAGL